MKSFIKSLLHSHSYSIIEIFSEEDIRKAHQSIEAIPDSTLHDHAINFYKKIRSSIEKMHSYKSFHYFHTLKYRKFIIIASFMSTLSIGISAIFKGSTELMVIALTASTSVTAISLWEGLYKDRELYLVNTQYLNKVFSVFYDFEKEVVNASLDKDKLDSLEIRYQSIIGEFYETMHIIQSTEDKMKQASEEHP